MCERERRNKRNQNFTIVNKNHDSGEMWLLCCGLGPHKSGFLCYILFVEKYLFKLSKVEHTSFKRQSNSNRIFTGYIPVQYRISGYLNYLQNCVASSMEHPRCFIQSLTQENKTKHKNKSNHGGQKTAVVALKNDQIDNRIYGSNVKYHAQYDCAFCFEWNTPQVFLILYFLCFQTFLKTRFRVGLQTETCYFHCSSSS